MNHPLPPRRYTGQFVYKYRTVERLDWLEQIVLQNLLYFPTARDLNDPEEARPPLTTASIDGLIHALIAETIETRPHLTNNALAYHARVIDYNVRRFGSEVVLGQLRRSLEPLLTRFRIYSQSTRPDNLHLWQEYAGQHTGYCLEFRNAGLGPIWEVRYDDIAVDLSDDSQLQPYFLFYKTKKWQREEEVRMMKQQVSDAYSTFDPTVLTRIILGRSIAQTDETEIRSMAERRNPPLPVVLEALVMRKWKGRPQLAAK